MSRSNWSRARRQKDAEAAEGLQEALRLWHTPALANVTDSLADRYRAGLDETRLRVVEDRVDVELRLGRQREMAAELRQLVTAHPRHERLHGQLMRALHLAGRDAEALELYAQLHDRLVEELGSQPGPELQQVHLDLLRVDPGAAPGEARPPPPADPSRPPPPAELPASALDFTGRAEELRTLDDLAAADPAALVIVAVTGPAGVGKTALLVHWAHQLAARFPDGQLYADLGDQPPGQQVRTTDALAGFLRSLGVPPDRVPVKERAAAATYRSLLAGKRTLVVLDNVRDGEQIASLLPGSPGCLVLVTSRDRLTGLVARSGARRLVLDVLPVRDAVLIVERMVGADRTADEPAATEQLTEACSRLPLALRIAAANLADQPDTRIADCVEALRRDGWRRSPSPGPGPTCGRWSSGRTSRCRRRPSCCSACWGACRDGALG